METVKGYRYDRTLSIEFIPIDGGGHTTKKYDKTGTYVVESYKVLPKISDETRELVKSAELLSKKIKKRQIRSIQKERG